MTRTLADMTPEERAACVGRWFELQGVNYLVILASPDDPCNGYATVMIPDIRKANTTFAMMSTLTPRFDLPRAWTPDGEPVPGEWEERTDQDGIGDRVWFTRQRRYITDWEEA